MISVEVAPVDLEARDHEELKAKRAGDGFTSSSAEAPAKTLATSPKFDQMTPQAIVAAIGELEARSKSLPAELRGRALMFIASGHIELAGRNIDKTQNGSQSLAAHLESVKLAPADPDVVLAYARTMYTMSGLPFFIRKPADLWMNAKFGHGIDWHTGRALRIASQLPPEPGALVSVKFLAERVGDKVALAAVKQQLDSVPARVKAAIESSFLGVTARVARLDINER